MQQGQRIVGLDAWRAVLLLGGPLTHAATVMVSLHLGPEKAWNTLTFVTHAFRMQAFFFISGMVIASVNHRGSSWFGSRIAQLAIPLVSIWVLVLIPIELFKIYLGRPGLGIGNPQHLWFLMTLVIGTILFQFSPKPLDFVVRLAQRIGLVRFIALLLLAWTALCFINIVDLRYTNLPVIPLVVLIVSPRFLLFYVFGLVCARVPEFVDQMRRSSIAWIGIGLLIATTVAYYHLSNRLEGPHNAYKYQLVVEITAGIVAMPICCAILHSALLIKRIPAVVWRLTRASYTIYLMHVPILDLMEIYAYKTQISPYLVYMLLALGCLYASLALHSIISKYRFTRLLFNGKLEGSLRMWSQRHSTAV